MTLSFTLLLLSVLFYALTFLLHVLSFSGTYEGGQRFAVAFMRIGFLISTFYLVAEAIDHGFFLPVANFAQAMAFFAWSLAFVYLVFLVRNQSESFGVVLSPILLFLVLIAALAKWQLPSDHAPIKEILHNPYFILHITCAFFAYASFTLSFSAGLLYLILNHELKSKNPGNFFHKLPPLEELERLIYQPLLWGAPLLAAAIGIGFVWAKVAYGEFWIFDPKTLATAATVLLYFVILYLRYISSVRGKQVAIWSLIAFGFVIFSFIGTRFIAGSHNYLQ
jgi:ABC-type uncharacterized transport system permease subunit